MLFIPLFSALGTNANAFLSGIWDLGSVLGPLLFLMYINVLEIFLKDISISQYADDTFINYSDSSQRKINLVLSENLRILADWCEMNS